MHEFFLQDFQTVSEPQILSYSMRTGCFISAAKLARAWSLPCNSDWGRG